MPQDRTFKTVHRVFGYPRVDAKSRIDVDNTNPIPQEGKTQYDWIEFDQGAEKEMLADKQTLKRNQVKT